MLYTNKKYLIWGLGISDQQKEQILAQAGERYALRAWGLEEFAAAAPDLESMPCLICCSLEGAALLRSLPEKTVGHLEMVPTTLLLDTDFTPEDLEKALDLGATDIVRPPLTKKRLLKALRRAGEAAALQQDMQNMVREIYLERELLERKNETLSFLVGFLTQTAEQHTEEDILRTAYTGFKALFPVLSLHAALWADNDEGHTCVDLFLSTPDAHPSYAPWKEQLLEAVAQQLPRQVPQVRSSFLASACGKKLPAPADGHVLTLPLTMGKKVTGVLMLLTSMERNLSRDQAQALDSAMRHLALTLHNIRRLENMRKRADYDSLTGIHNRRHFETTLAREMERHQRYGLDLSMLMLDLDRFKHINDTWGHQAGDRVLRDVTTILQSTLRKTDYCARYGGEEFVILLPHSNEDSARLLAERLRRKIQSHAFVLSGSVVPVTASIGISCLSGCRYKTENVFTHEADMALYQAKKLGRNQVASHVDGRDAASAAI